MDRRADREILLALLRAEPMSAPTPERWRALEPLAEQHGVAPLLYQRVKSMPVEVPAEILQSMKSSYYQTAARNMQLFRQLAGVLDLFRQETIPAIVLKGGYLAEHIYGNIGARPMCDIDVLVTEESLSQVEKIMTRLDFVRSGPKGKGTGVHHHFGYFHKRSQSYFEIHWNLIAPICGIRVDVHSLWERSRPALVVGRPARAMSAEDQILHLCVHASVHAFEHGLRAICDLSETLRHYLGLMDWACLLQRARQWNAERCLYVNLWLAKKLLNAPVPEDTLSAIRPANFVERYALLAEEHLFASVAATDKSLRAVPNVVRFLADQSLTGKLRLLGRRAFPSRQLMAYLYPVPPASWRIFWFYLVRLKDLLQRHGRFIWSFWSSKEQMSALAKQQDQINEMRDWLLSG